MLNTALLPEICGGEEGRKGRGGGVDKNANPADCEERERLSPVPAMMFAWLLVVRLTQFMGVGG